MLKHIVPVLGGLRHKGQNGKVGVIGGSFEYTGAPYYVAMSIIKGNTKIFIIKVEAILLTFFVPNNHQSL